MGRREPVEGLARYALGMRTGVAASFLLLTGCARGDTLVGVDIVDATLADVTLFYGGVILGVEAGGGTLRVTTVEGDALEVPVNLAGPRLGMIVDIAYGTGIVDIPLVIPSLLFGEASIPGEDLLGTYEGLEYAGAAIVGVHYAALTNASDVLMLVNTVDIGITGSFNYAWLTVTEVPEE